MKRWPNPAFDSSARAFLFCVVVLLGLLLPVLLARFGPPPGEEKYADFSRSDGSFPLITERIFRDREEIDILFVGNSGMWADVDTPAIQRSLEKILGRPARVLTFAVNFPGRDVVYHLVRDTLARHRVRLLVLSMNENAVSSGWSEWMGPDPASWLSYPHLRASRFFRYGEEPTLLEGLSLRYRARVYAAQVLGAPRNLLNVLHPPRGEKLESDASLGSLQRSVGFGWTPFVKASFPAAKLSPAELTHGNSGSAFSFGTDGLGEYQMHFVRRIADLVKKNRVPTIVLNLPRWFDRKATTVAEQYYWPELFGPQTSLVGVAPSTLFRGLSEESIRLLYYDELHLNTNGTAFFTETIAPAILAAYGQTHLWN